MDIPKSCNECPHTDTCPAPHYGADGCEHEEFINRETINQTLKGGN